MCASFAQALMERIIEGTMIPKVQTEREVAPILSMFLEEILTEAFKSHPHLSGPITMICPEFPLKKQNNRQSTNIDWLMRNSEREQLVFVELKTSDTSVDTEQSAIYLATQSAIRDQGASFLVEDLRQLRDASGEHGKYTYVLKNGVEPLYDAFAACREAAIVYLVPKSAEHKVRKHADRVLTFSELPDSVSGPFAAEWEVVRPYLCRFDEMSRTTRNRGSRAASAADAASFTDRVDYDSILRICRESGDDVIVGFNGGIKALVFCVISSLTEGQRCAMMSHVQNALCGTGAG